MHVLLRVSSEFMSHDHSYGVLASRNKKMLESLAFRLSKICSDDYVVADINGISKQAKYIECISQHDSDLNYSIIKDSDFREKWEGDPELDHKLRTLDKQGCSGLGVKRIPVLTEIERNIIADLFKSADHSLGKQIESIRDVYTIEKGMKKLFLKKKDSQYYFDNSFKHQADNYMGFFLG